MKKWLKTIKNEKGLTLIELLAVVVILGIIAAIAIPSISGIIENSKKDAHVANALLIINAAKLAEASNATVGTTPVKVSERLKGTTPTNVTVTELVNAGFLDSVPKDPQSNVAYDGTTSVVTYDSTAKVYKITLKGSGTGAKTYFTTISEETLNNVGREAVGKTGTAGSASTIS
ncbi:prepilin-type N-terminal cleavage/methylation domain-containing protein [Psychrobacillus sp. FSL K6-2836]|uniref:prepilin-type N-terminal cleavage/methylation domain-containing protein n=1 Tax=Psychrobacillus sp. FSL K6-2836 TaxID=2921548 RepID=UPI0030F65D14